ncbi:MAG: carbamoyl-phosphate synthase large subunit [Dehalococcoidia bacterium]|nr:carbamoyl-phosphate synthase large subunit [Dehalococcoidia bacterium]MDD5495239.1 carbamoyl-phosphate synthase large subunit [Dehalococcoidia bacterium]
MKVSKVLIIGSGPIVIGQAAEFDYAGAQACKSMREEGVASVLVNSNPATIMTDPGIADVVYIEPLNVDALTHIIERERPDSLLPTLGGQTGLTLAYELSEAGVLDKYNVTSLGTPIQTIKNASNRELFKQLLISIGEPMLESASVISLDEARQAAGKMGLPLIIRPSFTLGGIGGGVAYAWEEFETMVTHSLAISPIHLVLLEQWVGGWKEIEYEVMRDAADNCITVCNMENFDPMGVHTGDSIVVVPSQTLTNKQYQMLRTASLKIIRALGIEGGCNIQFSLDPKSDRYFVIEVNPRVSRSSALASKAAGYPIARIAAKIAVGKTLDQIPNQITGKTMASFEPALDYVVVKIPHWPFEKFRSSNRTIGTQMKATGEVMAIDRCFEGALQKAVRSLESSRRSLLWEDARWKPETDINSYPLEPNDLRLWAVMAALRNGITPEAIRERTGIDPWFTTKLQNIIDMEKSLRNKPLTATMMLQAKRLGFSDEQIGVLINKPQMQVREIRSNWDIQPVYKIVDTCAAEFDASTPYFYSTYEQEDEANPTNRKKVVVIGSGPIRIGQGIEFDYCCVHATFALRDEGYETIMINCNPETVSTDYDTSDKLFFEPLTVEDVLNICQKEKPIGVIVQFGGQTPLNIAAELEKAGVKILGTPVNSIDIASDRGRFKQMMEKYSIPMPESGTASSLEEALVLASRIGYPLIVRPSYVIGGRGMEIVHDEEELRLYVDAAIKVTPDRPILIERYLENAIETEADALSDGENTFIPAVMEHIEYAGVHSGDAACVIPPVSISRKHIDTIEEYTRRIAIELSVVGVMNVQYAIYRDRIYVLEANPRASRTVPVVSKVCNINMAGLATQLMMGKKISDLNLKKQNIPHYGVKESVFPFNMFPEVDPLLRPEMQSTGEVLGIADSFGLAYWKAQEAVAPLPTNGTVLITVADRDKQAAGEVATQFNALGFKIRATAGTHAYLAGQGIPSVSILKEHEGKPNITDAIAKMEIHLVINTPEGKLSKYDDSYIRKAAIKYKVPYITTLTAAVAAAKGISAYCQGKPAVKSLQDYHSGIPRT